MRKVGPLLLELLYAGRNFLEHRRIDVWGSASRHPGNLTASVAAAWPKALLLIVEALIAEEGFRTPEFRGRVETILEKLAPMESPGKSASGL